MEECRLQTIDWRSRAERMMTEKTEKMFANSVSKVFANSMTNDDVDSKNKAYKQESTYVWYHGRTT